jgi:hypothetical protein
MVEDMLVEVYLDVDETIRESDRVVEFVVDVNGTEVIANMVPPKEPDMEKGEDEAESDA